MELNYIKALKSNNLTEDDLIISTKNEISELNQLIDGYNTLQEKIENSTDDSTIENLQQQANKIESAINAYDAKITKKIGKNSFYKEQAIKLKEGREKKNAKNATAPKAAETAPIVKNDVVETQTQNNATQQANATVANSKNTTETVVAANTEEKKKSSFGFGAILLTGVAIIAAAFGISKVVNRE